MSTRKMVDDPLFSLDAPGSKELAIALMDGQRFRLRWSTEAA
jgi:hypothetical protein